jgi:ankyrin repeat protein
MPTIFELVDADDARSLRELLERDPGAAASRDEDGNSPLMRAAYRRRRAAFDAILAAAPPLDPWDRLIAGEARGLPPPDAWSRDGFTPLHLAAFAHSSRVHAPSSRQVPTRTRSRAHGSRR